MRKDDHLILESLKKIKIKCTDSIIESGQVDSDSFVLNVPYFDVDEILKAYIKHTWPKEVVSEEIRLEILEDLKEDIRPHHNGFTLDLDEHPGDGMEHHIEFNILK